MSEARDNIRELLKDLEREHDNTIVFLVESACVFWSPNPGLLQAVGFRVVFFGAVEPKDSSPSALLAKYPRGFAELLPLPDSGYPPNDKGQAIVGLLSILGDEIAAKLFLPAEDLRALATLASMAAKESPPVRVWIHAFGGLKDWDGKETLMLARTTIRIG